MSLDSSEHVACRRGAGDHDHRLQRWRSCASRDHAAAERETCGRNNGGERDRQGHVRRYSPASAPIKLDSDPACAQQHPGGLPPDSFVVSSGGLENVFVYVKDGLGDYYFETPTTAVTLDQKGCHYTPHVFGVRAGQPLEIVNSDPTLHNVNAMAKVNQSFNLGQAIQGMKNQKVFKTPEVMVHIKCDVHNWMNAYAGVLNHPYFAVTANGGSFELKGLPPGTYTIEAWHEKLGTQTQSVTLAAKESKPITFAFKAS